MTEHIYISYWRRRHALTQFRGEICPDLVCRKPIFPPRDICPHCSQNTFYPRYYEQPHDYCVREYHALAYASAYLGLAPLNSVG